ncbi:MAG: hypothetical protein RMJ53_04795 [Chitinophagales bacterium]|nr:hypothetical protein [Chitinophagales bacterium]MDW8273530.1 hypothetical protein [Chitinophagales bacterium]
MNEPFEYRWFKVRKRIEEQFGKRPDLNALLYLIGMNEVGIVKEQWTKEEKQDLIHVAVCKLLSADGYYTYVGKDRDGWPHYEQNLTIPSLDIKEQERLLKEKIVEYFENL